MTQQIEMPETVKSPYVQFIDKVVDVPAKAQTRVSTGMQSSRKTDQTVEVAKVILHERILKPAGERASVRERVREFEKNGGVSCSSTVEVLDPALTTGRAKTLKTVRRESDANKKVTLSSRSLYSSLSVKTQVTREQSRWGESAEFNVSKRSEGEREGEPSPKLDGMMLAVRDVKSELLQVRELVGVLVRSQKTGRDGARKERSL